MLNVLADWLATLSSFTHLHPYPKSDWSIKNHIATGGSSAAQGASIMAVWSAPGDLLHN